MFPYSHYTVLKNISEVTSSSMTYTITSSLESYQFLFLIQNWNQNRRTGDLVQCRGFFFRKVAYSSDDVASEMV